VNKFGSERNGKSECGVAVHEDASANPLSRFENRDGETRRRKVPSGRQSRGARPNDDDFAIRIAWHK
jgi:hypothetical protein